MTDGLVARLAEARRGGARLAQPSGLPADLDAAYDAARALARETGGQLAGWKVGATSERAQAALGVPEPIRGRVFVGGVLEAPAELDAEDGLEAEPEIIIRVADQLEEGVVPRSAEEALGLIGQVCVGLEVNRPSYADPFAVGAAGIVADNAAHRALVVGPRVNWGTTDDLARVSVTLRLNGEAVSEGLGADVLGDPVRSLVWLAGALAEHEDGPLRAGDWVATGAMARSARLSAGDELVAAFTPGGAVRLNIKETSDA